MNQDKVLKFYKCLSGDTILNYNSWEEARKEQKEASEFLLTLFISHRWESFSHADPTGKQYRAVQNLIRHIIFGVRSLYGMELGEHHKYIPDLGKHGVLQGAMIAFRLFNSVAELLLNGDNSKDFILSEKPEQLIGIWYDLACLPQGERSEEETIEFQYALQNLPNFVQHPNVSIVSLREDKDDYEQRGWCMMEFMLATQQPIYAPLVYRYDLDGEVLQTNTTKAGLNFSTSLKKWKEATAQSALECWRLIFLQTNTLPDSILIEEETPPLSIRTTLAKFVAVQSALYLAEKQNSPTKKPIEILKNLQLKTDLLTTLPEDGIIVYLMILVGGCSEENILKREFEVCLEDVIMDRV